MTINEIRNAMLNDGNMIYFSYNGKECGADIESGFPSVKLQTWCGQEIKYYKSFEKMITDNFFDGHSLSDLLDTVEIYFE